MVWMVGCARPAEVDFRGTVLGLVPVGESQSIPLMLGNEGDEAAVVQLETEGDFSVDPPSLRLEPKQWVQVTVTFTPREVALLQGRLIASFGDRQRALILRGWGTGRELSISSAIVFPPSYFLPGTRSAAVRSEARLGNISSDNLTLTIGAPIVEGPPGLCVGEDDDDDGVCEPWASRTLGNGTSVSLPVVFRPQAAGEFRWQLRVPSNDVVAPERTIGVRATTRRIEACSFALPSEVVVVDDPVSIALRHDGDAPCLVESAALQLPETGVGQLETSSPLPHLLEPGETLVLTLTPTSFGDGGGAVVVKSRGHDPRTIPVRREGTPCFEFASSLDFGSLRFTCAGGQAFTLKNVCSAPIALAAPSLGSAAGEAPGGPNCPGTVACPEFKLVSPWLRGTVLGPGESISVQVEYEPINLGADTGALVFSTLRGVRFVAALMGSGNGGRIDSATFRADAPNPTDVLFLVDPSPSFVPRRGVARQNLERFVRRVETSGSCVDVRMAIAAADGEADAGVELLRNDAGQRWTTSGDPAFVERVLGVFDTLPVGSETEACIGPAADLVADAGVRRTFSGVCVTDALEQSPAPQASLQQLRSLVGDGGVVMWHSVFAKDASCNPEALDDGTHATLAGFSERTWNVCDAQWFEVQGSIGSCSTLTYSLSSRPNGLIEVRADGVLLPQSDWSYDAQANRIVFTAGREPPRGTTVTVTWDQGCSP